MVVINEWRRRDHKIVIVNDEFLLIFLCIKMERGNNLIQNNLIVSSDLD